MQGFFGKIPSHGDFVTRNLPRHFLDGWDEWLQRAIAASKAELGEAWLTTFLNSPIWRFVLLPGVCGDRGWAGIVMPSVDRVGRYFPLTIASSLHENACPFTVAEDVDHWFNAAESLALGVLNEEHVDADALEESLSALDDTELQSQPDNVPALEGSEWGIQLSGIASGTISSVVAHELVRFQVGPYSLWWTAGSADLTSLGLVAPNLPDPQCFARLLQDTWGDVEQADSLQSGMPEDELAEDTG